MKIYLYCFCAIIFICAIGIAQEKQDVVYLKNGDIRKGVIIENLVNDYVKIETEGGSTFTIKYSEIEKFTKEAKPVSSGQQSSSIPDAQKLMIYESGKKSPTMGVLLSCLLTSAGHAYADNWGRGLGFTAGRLAGAVVAMTLGIKKTTESGSTGWYTYTEEKIEITPIYYVGLGVSVILAIWEMVDASAEVERYNKHLYDKLMGTKPEIGMNLFPTKDGSRLVLSYSF